MGIWCLQARLLLEEVFTATATLPDGVAGLSSMPTGVYIGCMYQEYADVLGRSGAKLTAASATGNSLAFMAGRQNSKPTAVITISGPRKLGGSHHCCFS